MTATCEHRRVRLVNRAIPAVAALQAHETGQDDRVLVFLAGGDGVVRFVGRAVRAALLSIGQDWGDDGQASSAGRDSVGWLIGAIEWLTGVAHRHQVRRDDSVTVFGRDDADRFLGASERSCPPAPGP